VAQLWRSKLPAIVAKHSPVGANPRHRLVAEGVTSSEASLEVKAIAGRLLALGG